MKKDWLLIYNDLEREKYSIMKMKWTLIRYLDMNVKRPYIIQLIKV